MTNTKLTTSAGFNPYLLNCKTIDKIIFFKEGETITSVNWFGSNNNYPEMIINDEIKRKNNIDLNSKKPFFINIKQGWDKGRIILYIPANLVKLTDKGEGIRYENENETQYQQNYTIEVECSKWEIEINDNGKLEYSKSVVENRVIEFSECTIRVKKDKLINDEQLKDEIKELCNLDIYMGDLQKILKHYTITKID
jgi:hypothetical protein